LSFCQTNFQSKSKFAGSCLGFPKLPVSSIPIFQKKEEKKRFPMIKQIQKLELSEETSGVIQRKAILTLIII